MFALGAAACVLGYLFLLSLTGLGRQGPTAGILPVVVLAASVAWLTLRSLRADRLPSALLGFTRDVRPLTHFALGFLGGSVLAGLWLAIVMAITGADLLPNPTFRAGALLGACVFILFNNAAEELVYRGYAFVRLADRYGAMLAIGITSSLFALLHLQAGLPLLSVLAGVLTTGLVLGALFARWRSLPLALGFHVATNVIQEASGLRSSPASLFAPTYPPSASALGTATLAGIALVNVVLAGGLFLVARRSGLSSARSN